MLSIKHKTDRKTKQFEDWLIREVEKNLLPLYNEVDKLSRSLTGRGISNDVTINLESNDFPLDNFDNEDIDKFPVNIIALQPKYFSYLITFSEDDKRFPHGLKKDMYHGREYISEKDIDETNDDWIEYAKKQMPSVFRKCNEALMLVRRDLTYGLDLNDISKSKKNQLNKTQKILSIDANYRAKDRQRPIAHSLRAHKSSPKRKSGIAQLENSVRRMF